MMSRAKGVIATWLLAMVSFGAAGAPSQTPQPIVTKISQALEAAVAAPTVRRLASSQGSSNPT